ncbi:MAG TPA: phenylalanine--tRNA ligase beta subunit-related protein [Thermoanaerobaculia bacterium]
MEFRLDLAGWDLVWVHLVALPPIGDMDEKLAALRHDVSELARASLEGIEISAHRTAAAIRKLFRAAGCDPTRYRPSSEALLRRVLKGEDLPAIHPLVDLNNCLSVELAVPCGLASEGSFTPPVTLRAGRPGESYESLRGPFNLEGKPLLADASGPFSTPITDSQRGKVTEDTTRVWMVAYLPEGVVTAETVLEKTRELLHKAPVARIEG